MRSASSKPINKITDGLVEIHHNFERGPRVTIVDIAHYEGRTHFEGLAWRERTSATELKNEHSNEWSSQLAKLEDDLQRLKGMATRRMDEDARTITALRTELAEARNQLSKLRSRIEGTPV